MAKKNNTQIASFFANIGKFAEELEAAKIAAIQNEKEKKELISEFKRSGKILQDFLKPYDKGIECEFMVTEGLLKGEIIIFFRQHGGISGCIRGHAIVPMSEVNWDTFDNPQWSSNDISIGAAMRGSRD